MAEPLNINDLLDGHVMLDLECLDRIYLNAYVPTLQVGGQVVTFLTEHLGNPIPSPVLFAKIGGAFRAEVRRFAEAGAIPLIHFRKGDRHIDLMRPYLDRAAEPGVVAIGVAQEFQSVFTGYDHATRPGAVCFGFSKADRRVTVYYFYVLDPEFGPGFIKICSYFPYPGKVWVNGHEWAKRQTERARIAYTPLANGFSSCSRPAVLTSPLPHSNSVGPSVRSIGPSRTTSPEPVSDLPHETCLSSQHRRTQGALGCARKWSMVIAPIWPGDAFS